MVKLTQHKNAIYIENAEDIRRIEISYSGSFVGEVIGNSFAILNRNKILIDYITPPKDIFMIYEGNFRIKTITAYNIEKESIDVRKSIKSDEWKRVAAEYDTSTTKWANYNESIKSDTTGKTLICSTLHGNKMISNPKGHGKINLKGMEIKKLNRIRGKYGIK